MPEPNGLHPARVSMTSARLAEIGRRVVAMVASQHTLLPTEQRELLNAAAELLNACHFMGIYIAEGERQRATLERLEAYCREDSQDDQFRVELGCPYPVDDVDLYAASLNFFYCRARIDDALRDLLRLARVTG